MKHIGFILLALGISFGAQATVKTSDNCYDTVLAAMQSDNPSDSVEVTQAMALAINHQGYTVDLSTPKTAYEAGIKFGGICQAHKDYTYDQAAEDYVNIDQ